MKVAEIPFVVLRFQYQIARLPLQLIEDQVAARLRSEGPARLLYERSFGALDATVGKLLGDPQLEKRGAALSSAVTRSARPPRLTPTPPGTDSRPTPNWRPRTIKW